ncbi:MAG: glycosyltransferase, partial [Verrucomicrobiales bacterium]|nr:glycosyltransferase [Verrucomicrobiales bacterium]
HDGKLYSSRASFRESAKRINGHLRAWNARGFRSAFMLHRLDWLHDLDVDYDASTFDVDPFEPQPDAASTIFPFWVPRPAAKPGFAPLTSREGFVELPYTLPQDSTLFVYLRQENIDLWKQKVDWIAERGGMVLLNVHPDYIRLPGTTGDRGCYPPEHYASLLEYIRDKYAGAYWQALPRDVSQMVHALEPARRPRRPRHACMLTYSFFEQDNRVQRYARTLAARGDVVDVLSLRPVHLDDTPNGRAAKPAQSEADSGIRVHHLQDRRRNEKGLLDFVGKIASFFTKAATTLVRLQRLNRYEVIHVHNVPDFLVFAAWDPKLRGARVILDLHDLLPEFYQSKFKIPTDSITFRLLLLCERLSCRFAHHVIVSNDLWLEKVAQRSSPPERTTAFVNHVDTDPFLKVGKAKPMASPDLITAVFPGGLYHHQGLHVAIRSLALLAPKFPNLNLRIVGDGPERPRLQGMVEELGLSQRVSIEPPIPISRIPELLSTADIGVVPKLAEGFGNEAYSTKIMEFMAAGLPVVASQTRIDQFYFGKGEVHFFASDNPEDMARALSQVITQPELRETLVRKGRDYVGVNNWGTKSLEYLDLVDRLIDSR